MKSMLKKLLPSKLFYYWYLWSALKIYIYDIKRFILYSNLYYKLTSESKLIAKLTIRYHVVEKGLTMPETRPGFGKDNILQLISLISLFDKKGYDKENIVFTHSIKVVKEYLEYHVNLGFKLKNEKMLLAFIKKYKGYSASKQLILNRDEFFKYSNEPFDKFITSRKSIRNYSNKEIDDSIYYNCVKLAQASPSACNRQPNKIYIVKNPILIKKVLELQNGNRGFGHLSNGIVIFASDLSVWQGINERNEAYFNSGLFAMTFACALQFYKVGYCFLNWSVAINNDKLLHDLINIPKNEVVTTLLSCGYLPDTVKIAASPRKNTNNIIKIIS